MPMCNLYGDFFSISLIALSIFEPDLLCTFSAVFCAVPPILPCVVNSLPIAPSAANGPIWMKLI